MWATIGKLYKDEAGLSTVEYALILGGLIIGATMIWSGLLGSMQAAVAGASTTVEGAPNM